ncbi:MAG: acetate/propionate family kinase [Phycisphaerales bacterium]|nr:acetate/propionate family kinase [Phycisphaerales bacterium]
MGATESILVLNAGSSSLKFSVFTAGGRLDPIVRGQVSALADSPVFCAVDREGVLLAQEPCGPPGFGHAAAMDFLLTWCRREDVLGRRLVGAGHRVVHGGEKLVKPVRINAQVLAEIEALTALAPLHQAHCIAAIRALADAAPNLPQVSCFDTSFHRTQPALAQAFAIPRAYLKQGVRRYGFHGLSYEYIAQTLPRVDPGAAAGRTIVAHLGSGASLCAMHRCRSVATTMGFSAADGLVMGTRCGSIDPGVLLYLLREAQLDVPELERLLYEQSGLLGFSGISGDMRTLLSSDDPRAGQAIDLFVYRATREIGSMAAALGGLDALVFTGGIGESAASVRAAICRESQWLGVDLDEAANALGGPRITSPTSAVTAWVLPTNEEAMIARHTIGVLDLQGWIPGDDARRAAARRSQS